MLASTPNAIIPASPSTAEAPITSKACCSKSETSCTFGPPPVRFLSAVAFLARLLTCFFQFERDSNLKINMNTYMYTYINRGKWTYFLPPSSSARWPTHCIQVRCKFVPQILHAAGLAGCILAGLPLWMLLTKLDVILKLLLRSPIGFSVKKSTKCSLCYQTMQFFNQLLTFRPLLLQTIKLVDS